MEKKSFRNETEFCTESLQNYELFTDRSDQLHFDDTNFDINFFLAVLLIME